MMLGYNDVPPSSTDGEIFEPFLECGIKSMSIGSLIERDTPLIWRGPKACGAIEQLLTQTDWGDVDIMVIDMPPRTGDIQITMSQKINSSGAVIVSTPQDIALIDAVKGINLFKTIGVPVLGIIENMSYYICEKCGHRADIFGHAGAKKTAETYNVEFLGEIPLHYDIRTNADAGTPIVQSAPDSPYAKAYEEIAAKIAHKLQ
jgi:ATP-binding protein involved in chromosome partitioning